MKWRKILKG